ncbi:hypothetical protein, partial [Microbacterium phosphatis]|uniref:hypothetical protein n=1 Tax=Microbacterium phosphatis TaxID=3140248 RepID=UPI00313FEA08
MTDSGLRVLVRQRGIDLERLRRHREVTGDALGVLLAEGLQLIAGGRGQVARSDLLGQLGVADAGRLGRARVRALAPLVPTVAEPAVAAPVAIRTTLAIAGVVGAVTVTLGAVTIRATLTVAGVVGAVTVTLGTVAVRTAVTVTLGTVAVRTALTVTLRPVTERATLTITLRPVTERTTLTITLRPVTERTTLTITLRPVTERTTLTITLRAVTERTTLT